MDKKGKSRAKTSRGKTSGYTMKGASSGGGEAKNRPVSQPSQQLGTRAMPIAPSYLPAQKSIERKPDIMMSSPMDYAPRILEESKPLQPRQSFDIQRTENQEAIIFKNTDVERLRELARRAAQSLNQEGLID